MMEPLLISHYTRYNILKTLYKTLTTVIIATVQNAAENSIALNCITNPA